MRAKTDNSIPNLADGCKWHREKTLGAVRYNSGHFFESHVGIQAGGNHTRCASLTVRHPVGYNDNCFCKTITEVNVDATIENVAEALEHFAGMA